MFKKFAIAATAIALTAGAASASGSHFGNQGAAAEGDHSITLNLVRAEANGVVALESLSGDVLAMADVSAGANADVLVNVPASLQQDVIAKLIIDGQVADELRIDVR